MKKINKLLPFISIGSVVTLIGSTTLTSCSNQFTGYKNMLANYEPLMNHFINLHL